MMKRLAWLLAAGSLCAWPQKPGQVDWTLTMEPSQVTAGSTAMARLRARMDPGWHLYSFTTAAAIPTSIALPAGSPVESIRTFQPAPTKTFDPNFNSDTETFSGEVTFVLVAKLRPDLPAGPSVVALNLRYQTCSDKLCVPGRATVTAAPLTLVAGAPASVSGSIPDGYSEVHLISAAARDSGGPAGKAKAQDISAYLLVAFGFGLAAIFTPCVFPMIPITMSYFLNRPSGSRRESLVQAGVFCLGIIGLFTTLGLALTALMGPFGVVQLGSNPWVNGFISILFIAFGFSLLGAFELTIPSTILTRLDKSSQAGGFAGTLLMGLTFSLTSFACVGPFVGTLLAASVQGGGIRPVLGMVTFAAGLALPFFVLALFPSVLKRIPRSGGWLARVKVVMGFVILAASLKYLASLDQVLQWGVISRERFLAIWVVLFAMAGLYLLGFLRMEGIKPDEPVGLGRLFPGMALLAFALSLLPGMFGGRLGELDAFVPLAVGAESPGGGAGATAGLTWMKDQYRDALERARREGKRVLVSFTGYACTNCHWMKANMFTRAEIAAAMREFVLVELYTDGTDETSRINGELELAKFQTAAVPLYAILDADEKVLASFPGLTKDPQEYLAFLRQGASGAAPAAPVATASSALPQGLTKLDGTPLEAPAGRVVVVNFWATWCVPCIQEIPSFNRLHAQFGSRGVTVLGVSMDEDGPGKVQAFLLKHPMQYAVAMGSDKLTAPFKLDQLPVTMVFDRAGKAVHRFEGFTPEAELEKAVQAAL